MNSPRSIFREAAIDRLSSPDQLDRLVVITRPVDWIAGAALATALLVLIGWGVFGRIPTRVGGDGIMVGQGGGLVEASSAIGGRLGAVQASVGQRVAAGQVIATLAQADIRERQQAAIATLAQRDREYAQLRAASDRDGHAEAISDAARKAGFDQAAAAAQERAASLAREARISEGLVKEGLATQPELDQARAELASARQRAADARNAVLTLEAERLERQSKRSRELMAAQFRAADARLETGRLAALLAREGRIVSPVAGRVTEVKVSSGTVLAPGAPVAILDTGRDELQAVVYLPPDAGKLVRAGMRVRVEPATAKREEFGVLLGRVESLSPFPATPEGMTATLHNADLTARFRRQGAPYAAVVRLARDPRAPSGYRWSSGRGPNQILSAGTLVHAEVVTRERRPVELLLPLLRRVGGGG